VARAEGREHPEENSYRRSALRLRSREEVES
jgi:hypothetical protein